MSTADAIRERRCRWLLKVLDTKGCLSFPVNGWQQFQKDWEVEQARRALNETIEDARKVRPLHVVALDDGGVRIYPAESLN